MSINEQLIRALPFVANAYITVEPSQIIPGEATVKVFVRDSWTISADAAWFGDYYASVFDKNFLGSGNELKLRYYFPMELQANGAELQYNINNLWGSFADVQIHAGIGRTNNKLKLTASRKFILPSDHIYGLKAGYEQYNEGVAALDSTLLINKEEYSIWYGYSYSLDPNQGTTLYATTSANILKYNKRPYTDKLINPYYHNHSNILLSIGASRQNFFQGNMIYGYGRTEDIPFGYKFQLTAGLDWNEFHGRRTYIAALANWGDLIGSSFLNAKLEFGSYINQQTKLLEQGVLNAHLKFFSPLFKIQTFYFRQFFYSSATWGINRLWGDREQISYNDQAPVRGMWPTRQNSGSNRLTFGGETVMFTPLFLYNFRFAFYLWGDIGTLGYDPKILRNPISSSMGIGVRIKNERLIFNNIQLRLGFILKSPPGMEFETLSITNEKEFQSDSYRPETPSIVNYY